MPGAPKITNDGIMKEYVERREFVLSTKKDSKHKLERVSESARIAMDLAEAEQKAFRAMRLEEDNALLATVPPH